jgi:hypothetical protein
VVGVVVFGLVAAVAGCGSGPEAEVVQDPVWAASAEAYLAAWSAATAVGFTNSAEFWAPNARVDLRELYGFEGMGRPAILQNYRDSCQTSPRFLYGFDQTDATIAGLTAAEPIYLSREGVVEVAYLPDMDWHFANVSSITNQGVEEMMDAVSIAGGSEYCNVPVAAIDPLVDGYVSAWASGDPVRIGDLYAEGAVLRDSLSDVTANGAAAIAQLGVAAAAEGGLPGAVVREFPDEGGRAYFINGPFLKGPDPVDQLVLLLDVGAEGGCPGPVAVVLDLDDQKRITREERYHRIDAARRCLPADDRPTGWWDEARIPVTPGIRITGWLPAEGQKIAIWNGGPQADPIIDWARSRFTGVGLPAPQPTSVTFLPPAGGDRWEACGFLTGSTAPDLGLPFTGVEACPDGPPCQWPTAVRAAALHEFAHLWLAPPKYGGRARYEFSSKQVAAFLAANDLTWHDPDLPWAQQGNERAAETLAWGLMDQPYTVDPRLGPMTCEQLSTDFQTLTGALPDPRACAELGTGSAGTP